jgi:hypothetical protein
MTTAICGRLWAAAARTATHLKPESDPESKRAECTSVSAIKKTAIDTQRSIGSESRSRPINGGVDKVGEFIEAMGEGWMLGCV